MKTNLEPIKLTILNLIGMMNLVPFLQGLAALVTLIVGTRQLMKSIHEAGSFKNWINTFKGK